MAAVVLPGLLAVVLMLVAAIITARDVRRSARIPSPGQQQRLERRRRDYLSSDVSVIAGERQPLP